MKKLYIIICCIALCGLQSCSLKENPTSFANRANYFENEAQCLSVLNSCYNSLNNLYTSNLILMTEACTDIWYSTSTTTDAVLDVNPAKPQYGKTAWTYGYQGVMRCNECIECISKANIDQKAKDNMVAEARVLRGVFYYFLTCTFNGVPYYEFMVKDDDDLLKIRSLPRTDAATIRENVYVDIRDNAIPYFSDDLKVRGSEAPDHRAGYALGLMIMAKCALWDNNFELALEPLKKLEEIYGDLTEENYPLDQIMWRYKNTNESIFEIQHGYSATGVKYYKDVARMLQPKYNGNEQHPCRYNGVDIPSLGSDATAWNACRSNYQYAIFRPKSGTNKEENSDYSGAMFNPLPLTYSDEYSTSQGRYLVTFDLNAMSTGKSSRTGEKIDRRVYYKLGMGNLDSLVLQGIVPKTADGKVFDITRDSGNTWAGPQFWCPDLVKNYDGNNYKIYRYADAVLMMAECYIGLGDSEKAMYYLNKTRARAGISLITNFTGFENLTAELRCERARELGGEFMRKFDLVRWDIWYEQTYSNTHNSELKKRMKRCHRYYPIPDKECSLSGYVLTNDEYLAEGF